MKRFRRILFNTLTAISLLLAIATAGLWVRSYWIGDQWSIQRDRTRSGQSALFAAQVISSRGGLEVIIESGHASSIVPDRFETRHSALPAIGLIFQSFDRTLPERLGLRLVSTRAGFVHNWQSTDATRTYVNFPHCFAAIVFAGMPLTKGIAWGIASRRRRRALLGICSSCGYDMRANPAKCSECGHEPSLATVAKRDGLTP